LIHPLSILAKNEFQYPYHALLIDTTSFLEPRDAAFDTLRFQNRGKEVIFVDDPRSLFSSVRKLLL